MATMERGRVTLTMETRQKIKQLKEEFEILGNNNARVMEIIDALLAENKELKRMLTIEFRDIDDENCD
jgi:hypothetical protein